MRRSIALLGYSGHAYEIIEICQRLGIDVLGYCEAREKIENPYELEYLGFEKDQKTAKMLAAVGAHIAIGDNQIRARIQQDLEGHGIVCHTLQDESALVSASAFIGSGSLIGKGSKINARAKIGKGVICNTGSIIEHDCSIGNYCHIGPGSILCGGVEIGDRTLVGAGAVIIPNIKIGSDVVIGANSMVNKKVPSGKTVVGNPSKEL